MPLKEQDIKNTFGSFYYNDYPDGSIWITSPLFMQKIVMVSLPLGTRSLIMRCHILIRPFLQGVFETINKENLAEEISYEDTKKIGGCFVPRHIRWDKTKPLSSHTWGIAVDVNPSTNPYGQTPKINSEIVKIFEGLGFEWGGKWHTPDGMHFEFNAINKIPKG